MAMLTEREVMQMALDALDMALPWVDGSSNNTDTAQVVQAIDALRATLKQPTEEEKVDELARIGRLMMSKGSYWFDLSDAVFNAVLARRSKPSPNQ